MTISVQQQRQPYGPTKFFTYPFHRFPWVLLRRNKRLYDELNFILFPQYLRKSKSSEALPVSVFSSLLKRQNRCATSQLSFKQSRPKKNSRYMSSLDHTSPPVIVSVCLSDVHHSKDIKNLLQRPTIRTILTRKKSRVKIPKTKYPTVSLEICTAWYRRPHN